MLKWNVFFMIGDINYQSLIDISTNTLASLENTLLEWELRGNEYSVKIEESSDTRFIGV